MTVFALFFFFTWAVHTDSTPIATTIKLSPIQNTTYPTPLTIVVKILPPPSRGILTLINIIHNQNEVVKRTVDLAQPLPSGSSSSSSMLTLTWSIVNAGEYMLQARFIDSSQNYSASESMLRSCSLSKGPVQLFLQATPLRQKSGQQLHFTLNITARRPPGPFNGQVQFYDNQTLVGEKTFSKDTSVQQPWVQEGYFNNVVNFGVNNFSIGAHRITAKLVESTNYLSAMSGMSSDVDIVDANSLCPFNRPTPFSHCNHPGLNCNYDLYCCPQAGSPCFNTTFCSCSEERWITAMADIICPTDSPVVIPPTP